MNIMNKEKFEKIIKNIADEHSEIKGEFIVNQHCVFESVYKSQYYADRYYVFRLKPGDIIETWLSDGKVIFKDTHNFGEKTEIPYKYLDNVKIFTLAQEINCY